MAFILGTKNTKYGQKVQSFSALKFTNESAMTNPIPSTPYKVEGLNVIHLPSLSNIKDVSCRGKLVESATTHNMA